MTTKQFKLLNLFSFVLLLGVLYLSFFYEEPSEFNRTPAGNNETASVQGHGATSQSDIGSSAKAN